MDITYCAQCGLEFEGKGIPFRERVFCGDECCEAFEAEFEAKDEPALDELEDDEPDLADDGDDFAINPDDF